MSKRMGLSSDSARRKAASPHSCQSMGWCAAERRYGLAESFKRFSECEDTKNPFGWRSGEGKPRSSKSASEKKRATGSRLLHDVSGAQIARVERLAPGKAFVLPVIKTNAVLAKLPAQIDVFVVDHRRKIQ